jgi:hypothetical protein
MPLVSDSDHDLLSDGCIPYATFTTSGPYTAMNTSFRNPYNNMVYDHPSLQMAVSDRSLICLLIMLSLLTTASSKGLTVGEQLGEQPQFAYQGNLSVTDHGPMSGTGPGTAQYISDRPGPLWPECYAPPAHVCAHTP